MDTSKLPRWPDKRGDVFAVPVIHKHPWWAFWRPTITYHAARCMDIHINRWAGIIEYVRLD